MFEKTRIERVAETGHKVKDNILFTLYDDLHEMSSLRQWPKLHLMFETWIAICDIIENLIIQNKDHQRELYELLTTYMNIFIFVARKTKYVLKNDNLRFAKYLA
jgi:hypothetical protein